MKARRLFASEVVAEIAELKSCYEHIQRHFPEHELVLIPRPTGKYSCGCSLPIEMTLADDEDEPHLSVCPIHKVP